MFHCWQLLSLTLHFSFSVPHLVKLMRKPMWALLRCCRKFNHPPEHLHCSTPNHQKTPKPVSLPNLSRWFMTCLWATVLFLEILVIWAISLPVPLQCICGISTENIQAKFEGGKMYSISVESSKQLEEREMWASRQWPAHLRSLFFFSDLLTAGEHVLWSLLLPADNLHFRLFYVAFAELYWASVIDWIIQVRSLGNWNLGTGIWA